MMTHRQITSPVCSVTFFVAEHDALSVVLTLSFLLYTTKSVTDDDLVHL